MPKFHVTYEVITEESARDGEAEERGFVIAGDWHVGTDDPNIDLSLHEALDLCTPQEDCGRWFTEVDARVNYRTGAEEYRSLHPPNNITSASYARLRRLFGLKKGWSA